jgi:hypothetical protein
MKNITKMIVGLIAIVAVASVADPRVGSNPVTYMLLVAIIIVAIISNSPTQPRDIGTMAYQKVKKNDEGLVELGDKEKKFLIFHILMQLDSKEAIDMGELAGELSVSIYELNSIIKTLGKIGAVEVIYPPLQNFPILRRGDPQKAHKLKTSIYHDLGRKNIIGDDMMDEFAKEVKAYLGSMRRKE